VAGALHAYLATRAERKSQVPNRPEVAQAAKRSA